MKIKNLTNKLKGTVIILILGISLAAGITFATAVWQGTGWITTGAVIDTSKIKANFDYLHSRVSGGNLPIICARDKILISRGMNNGWRCGDLPGSSTAVDTYTVTLSRDQQRVVARDEFRADHRGLQNRHLRNLYDNTASAFYADNATASRICSLYADGAEMLSYSTTQWTSPGDNWSIYYTGGKWNIAGSASPHRYAVCTPRCLEYAEGDCWSWGESCDKYMNSLINTVQCLVAR